MKTRCLKLGKLVLSFVWKHGRGWLTGLIPVTCTSAIQGRYPVFSPPDFPRGTLGTGCHLMAARWQVFVVCLFCFLQVFFPSWVPSGLTNSPLEAAAITDACDMLCWLIRRQYFISHIWKYNDRLTLFHRSMILCLLLCSSVFCVSLLQPRTRQAWPEASFANMLLVPSRRGHLPSCPSPPHQCSCVEGPQHGGAIWCLFPRWSWQLCGTLRLAESLLPLTEPASVNRWAAWQPRWPARHRYNLTGFLLEMLVPCFLQSQFWGWGDTVVIQKTELSNSASNWSCGFIFSQRRTHRLFHGTNIRQRR